MYSYASTLKLLVLAICLLSVSAKAAIGNNYNQQQNQFANFNNGLLTTNSPTASSSSSAGATSGLSALANFGLSNERPNQYQQQQYQQQQQQQQHQHQHQHQQQHQYQQLQQSSNTDSSKNGIIDSFNHRYPDGSYEFRYELTDGTARYERGYFLLYDKIKTLTVVGYYSYRMTDGRYITVFYNADQNGYRQNQSITPQNYPNLPRSIEIPQFKEASDYGATSATTPYPKFATTTTTRRGQF